MTQTVPTCFIHELLMETGRGILGAMKNLLLSGVVCAVVSNILADEPLVFPTGQWDVRNPVAGRAAEPGGQLVVNGVQTKSLNGYLDNFSFTRSVFGMMYETLLSMDPLTSEFTPGLAIRWQISKDRKEFTFELDPAAKWSDGKPVTAEDVRWTWERVMAPESDTGGNKLMLGVFDMPEVVGERTIRFRAKEVHWRTLMSAGGFEILPKHVFESVEFNTINFAFPVVSGPYRLGAFRENVSVSLERRDDWWARNRKQNDGMYNFQTLSYRFFADQDNAFDALRKGTIDVYAVYTARLWATETKGERFDRHWIVKQLVRNHQPVGFQGFAMNMRRPPYDDVRVRRALAHLLDRETLNRTFMYNAYFLHASYYEDLYAGEFEKQKPALIPYDPDAARKLFAQAGWAYNDKRGVLEKDGKPMVLTFLTRDSTSDRFLAFYAAELKKHGIEMKIDRKDFAGWMRDMQSFNFEMTWSSYGAGLFRDPEYMWSSAEADRPSGNNATGFKNERVDELIEKQKTTFNLAERNAILREIDGLLTREVPYVLLWNTDATRLLYWDKFGRPDTVLGKYGNEQSIPALWWYDEDLATELNDAMQNSDPLPSRPAEVSFDAVFGK